MDPVYLECECHSHEHLMRIDYDEDFVSISVQLNYHLPWYSRIYYGFKYIFKYGDSHWDSVLLNDPINLDKLINLLNIAKEMSNAVK